MVTPQPSPGGFSFGVVIMAVDYVLVDIDVARRLGANASAVYGIVNIGGEHGPWVDLTGEELSRMLPFMSRETARRSLVALEATGFIKSRGDNHAREYAVVGGE